MRPAVLILIAANLLLFALWQGGWIDWLGDKREPWRLAQQISPESLRLLPTVKERNGRCLEFGGCLEADLKRVEGVLEDLKLGSRLAQRQLTEPLGYMVYLPPFRSRADADRALNALRVAGVKDFSLIQDTTPLRLGISLGVYRSEDAAQARLATLVRQGVKGATVDQRRSSVAKIWFQVHEPSAYQETTLAAISRQFPEQEIGTCR